MGLGPSGRGTLAGIATNVSPRRTSSAKAERLPRGRIDEQPHAVVVQVPDQLGEADRFGRIRDGQLADRLGIVWERSGGRARVDWPTRCPEAAVLEELADRLDHRRE